MEKEYILACDYLSFEEVESIKERFTTSGIEFLITGHGPNFELESKFYQIKVKANQINEASAIIKIEKEAFLANTIKCPACGHQVYEKINKGILEKLLYAGTELVQCKACGKKFGI